MQSVLQPGVGGMLRRALRPAARLNIVAAARTYSAPAGTAGDGEAPQTTRAEKTLSRFWKNVSLAYEPESADRTDAFVVQLDRRSLRTPGGNILRVPSNRPLLACLVAQEWDEQSQVVKPHSLPMTSLAARAIDGLSEKRSRADVESLLMRYFQTDAVCYQENEPELLVQLQKERWDPLIAWVQETFGIPIARIEGLFGSGQAKEAHERLAQELSSLDAFDLAGFERAVTTSKSFIIALALLRRHIDAEQAALAAEVEVASQVHAWGAVEDSHDVDHAELRRQLASVACAQNTTARPAVERFIAALERRGGKL
ncbi:ATP synthase mitochondrial F1 complex assembly factor 2 [Malassezia cuniculi]|uniref:ATP synthase mitochondrial F1 complex assembly factor 2 n=1 Tax=Malassezia cuniculi TaxID=948313 RepID=A0AAF0ETH1_9BASI|nr:ATP synthase mitochondrial F1 complex assembly factor 2 [Malassezia cuniculi]